MNHSRIDIEKDVLTRYLHPNAFRFMDVETSNPFLLCATQTNNKKIYTLRIELSRFPYDAPEVYVMQMLKTKTGEDMNGDSVPMHTCRSKNGWTQIGHCYNCNWNPQMSLWSVYYRCLIWLNIYELHLQTGETMDTYLNHQSPGSGGWWLLFDHYPLGIPEDVRKILAELELTYDLPIERTTLNDVTINAGDCSLQNIANVIRIAQYGKEETIEYGLEFDPAEGGLKPVQEIDSLALMQSPLCEGYA